MERDYNEMEEAAEKQSLNSSVWEIQRERKRLTFQNSVKEKYFSSRKLKVDNTKFNLQLHNEISLQLIENISKVRAVPIFFCFLEESIFWLEKI